MVRRTRYFNYLVVNDGDFVFIRKRVEKDIWQDLYEFPLVETENMVEILMVLPDSFGRGDESPNFSINFSELRFLKQSQPFQQLLTHQKIIATFWEYEVPKSKTGVLLRGGDFLKIDRQNLTDYAFPKTIDIYLKEKVLTLF